MKHVSTFLLVILLTACAVVAQPDPQQRRGGRPGAEQAAPAQTPAQTTQAAPRGPAPEEKSVVTKHQGRFGGVQMDYTATAATYVIRADDGTPKATMFFVSYTKDGADPAKRPVSFVYNGGPGSASFWTHMGLGPKRVVLTDDGRGMPAPYSVVDNADSFLDATDMIFVDAIGTGFSRPAPGENLAQFYGVSQDAQWFADFIYQFLTRNGRWQSPKFLIGESYGTTRSAQLAQTAQQRHQIYLSGIVLVSAVGFGNWGADDRTIFFLPTYITSAWYHKLLPPDLQKLTMEQIAQQARDFAHGEYAAALEKGDQLTPGEHERVVRNLARFTGLSPKFIENANLRVSPQRWFKELMRSQRRTVGRLDSRFLGIDEDAAGERNEYDSSQASYSGPYAALFRDYVRHDLKWTSEAYYLTSGNVRPWDQGTPGQAGEALRSAMTQQGTLKVLVVAGYYDLATPFNGIEHTVSHMSLEPPVRKNVSFAYYEAGHMMYIDKRSREKLHKDVVGFINSSYKP